MWGAIAGAVVGGMLSSNASKSAANTQAGASREATAAQERMFDRQVELQKPFRDVGISGNNRLAYLLGLSTDPGTGGGTQALSYDVLRQQLTPQFTSMQAGTRKEQDPFWSPEDPTQNRLIDVPTQTSVVNQGALDAEILRRMQADEASRMAQAQGDTQFGSLMRDFSMADFEQDPGYEFRRTEGMKGVEGGAAARGGLLSGAALKAIQKYGQGLASQEYGNAYGRFNADQTNKYNRLAGVVNTGQGATNQITNAAGQLGQSTASNIIGAGNAQAAGTVGSANAWNQAIGQGINAYQSNQLMDLIRQPSQGFTPSYGAWSGGNYQVD